MYDAIRSAHGNTFETAETIRHFITENRSEFDKFIMEYGISTKQTIEKTQASQRNEHSEWFEGVPAALLTKEDVMSRRSQDRIRGFYYKAKSSFEESSIYRTNTDARHLIDEMLNVFQNLLIGVDYFSSLFNRKWETRHRIVCVKNDDVDGTKAPPRKKAKVAAIRDIVSDDTTLKNDYYVSLCDELGDFQCHGIWCDDRCRYDNHRINPYASRENVILFQMWNLDHQIEISRTLIPKILRDVEAIVIDHAKCTKHKQQPAKMLSVIKYFLELFTVHNLRLVHIICHDKTRHDTKSNGTLVCDKCAEFKTIQKVLNKIKKFEDSESK